MVARGSGTSDRHTDDRGSPKRVLHDMALEKLRSNVKAIRQDAFQRLHAELDAMVHQTNCSASSSSSRSTYPRTKSVRCWFVTVHLLEVLGAILLICFIVEHYLVPQYSAYGMEGHTWSTLATSVFRTMLPGTLILLCGFYLLLHEWLNGWAEALRFADRQFYRDCWNAASYGEVYRTWNVVVHDYLYEYVYARGGGRVLATCAVFTVSALVYEYILGFMLGFCYPVLFVQFLGLGMAFNFVRNNSNAGNIFLWTTLAIGAGVQVSFYSMELAARINCAQVDETWWDLFVPQPWSCNGLA